MCHALEAVSELLVPSSSHANIYLLQVLDEMRNNQTDQAETVRGIFSHAWFEEMGLLVGLRTGLVKLDGGRRGTMTVDTLPPMNFDNLSTRPEYRWTIPLLLQVRHIYRTKPSRLVFYDWEFVQLPLPYEVLPTELAFVDIDGCPMIDVGVVHQMDWSTAWEPLSDTVSEEWARLHAPSVHKTWTKYQSPGLPKNTMKELGVSIRKWINTDHFFLNWWCVADIELLDELRKVSKEDDERPLLKIKPKKVKQSASEKRAARRKCRHHDTPFCQKHVMLKGSQKFRYTRK